MWPPSWSASRHDDSLARGLAVPPSRSALSPRRAGGDGPDQTLLRDAHHEPPVAGEEMAEREAARTMRRPALLRVEQPLVGAERAVEPHGVVEARHHVVRVVPRDG